jgi:hypothetical protein
MKKYITLATAGLFLFNLQPAWAQQQVAPPPVPPMLEGQRPLAQPETREASAPKHTEEGKALPKAKPKVKAKSGKKLPKKTAVKKGTHKKSSTKIKKKSQKNHKAKNPVTGVKRRHSPVVG